MRIKSLTIQGFLSLADVSLQDLPGLVVLVGKNSSGKSNIINALSLVFLESDNGLSHDLGSPEDYHHLFINHDTQSGPHPTIITSMLLTNQEWAELLGADSTIGRALEEQELFMVKQITVVNETLIWRTEEIEIGDSSVVSHGDFVSDSPGIIYRSSDHATEELIDVVPADFLKRLSELLSSSFQVIHTTDKPRSWPNPFLERPTIIDSEQVSGLWRRSQSRGNQRQLWTKVTKQYEQIAPNGQRPAGVASSIQMEEGTLSVPIGMTGEGSQALFRLIDQLDRGPSIMAIEEPETHLHPALIKQVGEVLNQTTNGGKQLFVCTHSPFLVEQSSLDNFFIVKRAANETQVARMNDNRDLRSLLFDIGVRPSDILFSDAILLVEGLADEVFFTSISTKVNAPLAERHVKVVRANGKNRGKYKIAFWAEVGRDAGLPLYLVLDGNAQTEADQAIASGLIPANHCLVLQNGDLEDYYPWSALEEALSRLFNKTVDEEIPAGGRVKGLRALLGSQWPRNSWKPQLAERVSQIMSREEAESHLTDVVGFLRNIHGQLGVG